VKRNFLSSEGAPLCTDAVPASFPALTILAWKRKSRQLRVNPDDPDQREDYSSATEILGSRTRRCECTRKAARQDVHEAEVETWNAKKESSPDAWEIWNSLVPKKGLEPNYIYL
jgi:hypothetical protein